MLRYFIMVGWAVATIQASGALPAFPAPQKGDRIMVVAPHPDDEVLATGGYIQAAVAAGADVRVLYLTNGDHNQIAFKLYSQNLWLRPKDYVAFGKLRREEAIAATHRLGLTTEQLQFLGYPDAGTLKMWRDYWEPGEVFTSDATQTNEVPYPETTAYHHPYRPQNITMDFCQAFRQFRPTRLFVPHPADTNPDHRAVANFARLALLEVAGEGVRPDLCFYVVHFGSWPRPLHYHPEEGLVPPHNLMDDGEWSAWSLTTHQTEVKREAILENRTQTATRQYFLEAFARATEVFARIPAEEVPFLPGESAPDWKRAVRAKQLTVVPGETVRRWGDPLAKPVATTTVPLETIDFLRHNGDLIAVVGLRHRWGKRTGVHLYLYPFKQGVAFDTMPKMRVSVTPFGTLQVFVEDVRQKKHGVTVTSVGTRLILRVPMQLLGSDEIDHMFAAARANLGGVAADDAAWQLLELKSGHLN